MDIWTAFTIGLIGSFHCVGMCGPIALALPYQGKERWRAVLYVLQYNLGRVLTYALLGSVIGLAGKGLFLAGVQSYISIGLGAFLLLVAVFSINIEHKLLNLSVISSVQQWVKVQLGRLLKPDQEPSLFLIGLLNGLLPCGLVYVAIVGAVTTGGIGHAALYMSAFGLGTIPMMMGAAMAGQFIHIKWRNRLRKLTPLFLACFACLFIMRGLNFHIPIDLRFWESAQDIPLCH